MTNTPFDTQENLAVKTPIARGPSVAVAMTIAVVAAIIAVTATMFVIKNNFSTPIEALLAAVALVAFGVTAYGLIQAVLALVDTAGERRRQDREISERRHGDRARKPKTP
jgi:type VI protein secretion system component VasK